MIRQHVIDDIKKYSFVEDAYREKLYLVVCYEDLGGVYRMKKLHIRSTKPKLQSFIREIKKDSWKWGTRNDKKRKENKFPIAVA